MDNAKYDANLLKVDLSSGGENSGAKEYTIGTIVLEDTATVTVTAVSSNSDATKFHSLTLATENKKMTDANAQNLSISILLGKGSYELKGSGVNISKITAKNEVVEAGKLADPVTYSAVDISDAEKANFDKANSSGSVYTTSSDKTVSIWSGKGTVVTKTNKMGVKVNSSKGTVDAVTSSTNMSGVTATAVPVVGAALSTIGGPLTNYVKVATPAAGNLKVSMNCSTDQITATDKPMADFPGASFWILITDTDGKILAVKDIGDIHDAANNLKTADVDMGTIAAGKDICIGFARGAGSGGLLIHSITLTPQK